MMDPSNPPSPPTRMTIIWFGARLRSAEAAAMETPPKYATPITKPPTKLDSNPTKVTPPFVPWRQFNC